VALHDVAGGDELEAAGDVGAQPPAREVEQQLPHPRGPVVVRAEDGARGGDDDVEPVDDRLEALVLDRHLAPLVGQQPAERIDGDGLVARPGRVVADRAEGAGDDDALDALVERGPQHVPGAEHVAGVDLPLLALGARDLGRAVIEAPAARTAAASRRSPQATSTPSPASASPVSPRRSSARTS
jgi:hypothetical protein